MSFCKAMDKLPLIVKIILAIPALDIIWAIYRIVKGFCKKNPITLIFGILWIIPGSFICWLVDILALLFTGHVILAD